MSTTLQEKENPCTKVDDLVSAKTCESSASSDKWNYALLVFLYVLQGTFKGLIHSVPLILQENGATYEQQALFEVASLTSWMKLLWAPLIECIYFTQLGKRKSWLIPCQYLLGLIALLSSLKIDTWLGVEGSEPNLLPICALFLFCTFILNTIDVVVDSWALTILQRQNVGYQATCDIVGNRIGHFFGYILFMLLKSQEISGYFGQKAAILSFSGYLFFWSVVLLICNTGVWFFKKDNSLEVTKDDEQQLSIPQSYKLIWKVMKLKAVRQLSVVVLLSKAGVGPLVALTDLKLIQNGLKPEKLVLLEIPFIPLQSLLPFFFKRCFDGSQGLEKFSRTLIYMIPVGLTFCALIYYVPDLKNDNELSTTFYVIYFIAHGVEYMVLFLMTVSFMSFMAKISDPKYGAVYLTVIQTIRSIAFVWPTFVSLALMEPLTFYKSKCVKENDKRNCVLVDGYYIEVLLGSLFSVCFLCFGGLKEMLRIQNLDESVWHVSDKKKTYISSAESAKETSFNDVTV